MRDLPRGPQTASRGTITRYPYEIPSTAVARTQPEVEQPVRISVSTLCGDEHGAEVVVEEGDGYFFVISRLSVDGFDARVDLRAAGSSSCSSRSAGTFRTKSPPSTPVWS